MAHWLDIVVALLQADTNDLRELARIAGADPRTFYKGVDINDLDLNGQDLDGMEFSNALSPNNPTGTQYELDLLHGSFEEHFMHRIRRASRQEERAAMLLTEFLLDRSRAVHIISNYYDRAILTNSVVILLKTIRRQELNGIRFSNLQIARRVSGRFAKSEDKRHVLAYFLAKYLGFIDPEIRAWLKEKNVQKLSKDRQREFERFLREPPFIP